MARKFTVVVSYVVTETSGKLTYDIAPFSGKTESEAQRVADAWLLGMTRSYGPERFEVLTSRTFVL